MPLAPSDSGLDADQNLLIETVRDFARNELLPLDRRWDQDESSVWEAMPRLAELGLLSLCVPESFGGLGCCYRVYAAIIHELSQWSPSTAVAVAVHNMVGRILSRKAAEHLQREYLGAWGQAQNFAAFALTEAGAGSDAAGVKATGHSVEGGFRITGEKMWITNGMHARWFLTLVRLDGLGQDEPLSAVLVDGNEPGVERTKITGKTGIRGSETAVVNFSNVFVRRDHVLGDVGGGLAVCLSTLNEGRIGIAAQATGIAEACLEEMTAYARQREQFNQPIGRFQAVGNMIADSVVDLEAARALTWRAASLVDAGRSNRAASSMAKLCASESANRIAYRAVQVHGGAGYVRESRVEQLARDARVTTIYEGTSEIQRLVIARELGAAA